MEGVRDPVLRREFGIVDASEAFLTEPPTVESLRFTTRQLQRNCPKPTEPPQPYDPRLAMRSRPHPFVPLPPNKMVMPEGVLPPQHHLRVHRQRPLSLLQPERRQVLVSTAGKTGTLLASAPTGTKFASLRVAPLI